MNSFTFDGHSSEEIGLRIESRGMVGLPELFADTQYVPGRDGELISRVTRYGNAVVSYTVFFVGKSRTELQESAAHLRTWLSGSRGRYCDLTDTYEPDLIRRGYYASKLDITETLKRIGRCTVRFSCLPYAYTVKGRRKVTVAASGGSIFNPEAEDAYPFITVHGSGTGTLTLTNANGTKTWSFSSISTSVTLDSEEMECSSNGILSGDGTFPVLCAGGNTVTFTGGITSVDVIPGWRRR